jgi:hypothetical protein
MRERNQYALSAPRMLGTTVARVGSVAMLAVVLTALLAGVDATPAGAAGSPSYPSEYSATAAAVLGYLNPDDAQVFADRAQAATQSRLLAGAEYPDQAGQSRVSAASYFPTDVRVGLALGPAVAEKVIERDQADAVR